MNKDIYEKLSRLPTSPGVYLMKNTKGRILYVGKATDLKKRVSSYFRRAGQKDLKTKVLIKRIDDFEIILTNTEKEALILESNLIKRHRPRYNVILKDDKRYPCLRLDVKKTYPNLKVVRKIERDGALYFGPYPSSNAVRETLKFIHSTFKIRKCKSVTVRSRHRPCLNYQIGLCLGPCSRPVSAEDYNEVVREVVMFLKGRMPELIEKVRGDMEADAAIENFEAAAIHRDRLFALEKTLERQVVTSSDFKDRDVLGLARKDNSALVAILFVRGGFLLGNQPFYLPESILSDEEVITSFVKQYYGKATFIPKEVLLPTRLQERSVLEEWLDDLKGERVRIITPQRGEKAALAEMAFQNATKSLNEQVEAAKTEQRLLERVRTRLDLKRYPEKIECFDISNLAGSNAVGCMVAFEKGRPAQSAYRKYRIRRAAGRDDYAMLGEVLTRRYTKVNDGRPTPDLLIVDGGKGQLNQAVTSLRGLKLYGSFDVIGIAKKDTSRGEIDDKVYKPGRKNPVALNKYPDVLLFLQRIRDEAHRSAITYQRKRRLITNRHSVLETIPGIGGRRRMRLLEHFGSLKRIKKASIEELAEVPGMTHLASRAIFETLNPAKRKDQTPKNRNK